MLRNSVVMSTATLSWPRVLMYSTVDVYVRMYGVLYLDAEEVVLYC